MIDFAAIRSHRGSSNNGFEELVVQLARRQPPPGAVSFRRIEGAGGDAGAEALWIKSDGSAVGIQAKYFLRAADIDWRQIDESVATTLAKRPEVNVYRIALACDLTDRRGAKGRGRTGWEAWEDRVKTWEAQAAAMGRAVAFEAITASNLIDWLAQENAAGLARFWFGKDILSAQWFANQVHVASTDLGERYTPNHHVAVTAALALDGVARTPAIKSRLREAIEATWRHDVTSGLAGGSPELAAAAEDANRALSQVHSIALFADAPPAAAWDRKLWWAKVEAAEKSLDQLAQVLRNEPTGGQADDKAASRREHFSYTASMVRRAEDALRELDHLLRSTALAADESRVLLVTGQAGTGKSHLLAAEANRAVAKGRPALLFLGQQFAQGHPWDQCEQSLGLPNWPRDELFGALDAAGEAAGARTMILVDAVNEGAGASLWRSHLAGFIESLAAYPHLAVVIACRSEYVPYAIPKPVQDTFPKVELQGFATFDEQEAAAVQYLDQRGIVRPAGPMLAPEFSHPLFLKAASDALLKKGGSAFPRGLRGALHVLGFYLDSVGGSLLPASVEPVDLSAELRRALAALAGEMARSKHDYVPKGQAALVLDQTFAPRRAPDGMTWLDVLLRNGIVRLDPDPANQAADSFIAPDDVVRIAFQRFQDHLVAQSAMAGWTKASTLFTAGGPLEWLVAPEQRYFWSGLFEALSIQVPEAFGAELVDVLPGGAKAWWSDWVVQNGFAQSVRWRAITALGGRPCFTDRSLELLNRLNRVDDDLIGILLEVAAAPEHPWNADLLHRNLWRWKLNTRDIRWSRVIAYAADDEAHPSHRLINWSLKGRLDRADRETLRLVMVVLTWMGSTTSRYIRDVAARGLCRLLAQAPELHHDLLCQFAKVDDLYVLERLLAASYGAACQLGADHRVEAIATSTFDLIFADGAPPRHLLARDYALGTLEVAQHHGRLSATVDLAKARPPFSTRELRAPSKAVLEKLRAKAQDDSVYLSCNDHGDFGRKEIKPAVEGFSAKRLHEPAPLTKRNRLDRFLAQIVDISPARQEIFDRLETACREQWRHKVTQSGASWKFTQTRSKTAAAKAARIAAQFLEMLDPAERERYQQDAFESLFETRGERPAAAFDASWAQRWVTARVYGLGWTKSRFGDDRTPTEYGHQRAAVERVGKKYQWIALYELLAWLSDTHWVKSDWEEPPKRYAYPTDLSFQRDIDPTLANEADLEPPPGGDWWRLDFDLRPTPTEELAQWARQDGAWQKAGPAIFRQDAAGECWVTLYSFQHATEDVPDRERSVRDIGLKREGFLFVQGLLVRKDDLQRCFNALVADKNRDSMRLGPREAVDGPFLGEYPWRATWPKLDWSQVDGLDRASKAIKPIVEYYWESHLDASRPDGVRARLPHPRLLDLMGLEPPAARSPFVTKSAEGRAVIVHHAGDDGSYAVSVRRQDFETMLAGQGLGCLWFVFGERSAWPTGDLEEATRRWFGNLVRFDGVKTQTESWETPW